MLLSAVKVRLVHSPLLWYRLEARGEEHGVLVEQRLELDQEHVPVLRPQSQRRERVPCVAANLAHALTQKKRNE